MADKPTPTERLVEAHEARVTDLESKVAEKDRKIDEVTKERDRLTRDLEAARASGKGKWVPWLILVIIIGVLFFMLGSLFGLRWQNDCMSWNNFGRAQGICFTAEDGVKFVEELPPPDPAPQDPEDEKPDEPDEPEGQEPPGASPSIDPTATDDRVSDEERVEIIPANGVEKDEDAKAHVATQPPPPDDDPCDVTLIADLEKYFEYREWDTAHIVIIENALDEWKPGLEYTPIDLDDYDFWGGRDAANLKAFVRDQRFALALDGAVIEVTSETASTRIRYTVFRCECGITAIYREVKETVVYTPPPKKKYVPVPPPSDIPEAWCIDPRTKVQKTCA